jgi:serine protease Do
MQNRFLKTIIASFTAGALVMGGFWMGVENSSYFTEPQETSAPASTVTSSSIKQTLLQSQENNVIAEMVETNGPAVVKIETESNSQAPLTQRDLFFRQFFGDSIPYPQGEQNRQGLGSGFIISQDGYILTNHHVIDGADSIKVNVIGAEERYDAQVIGVDPELDIAVLKISAASDLTVLKLGDSDNIQVGDWSIAIGNPYGLDHTVTVGVISAKGRPLNIGQAHFKNLLQTDASINPGNSGGPLLNLRGEVIGINTAINAEAQGIGFAIPINTVQDVLEDLIEKGKVSRPWLGVSIQNMTPELAKYFDLDIEDGVVVGYVVESSPAARAGIQQGDVIVELNKERVENSEQFINEISEKEVGEQVDLLVIRGGQFQTLSVNIAEKKYNDR